MLILADQLRHQFACALTFACVVPAFNKTSPPRCLNLITDSLFISETRLLFLFFCFLFLLQLCNVFMCKIRNSSVENFGGFLNYQRKFALIDS